MKSVLLVLSLLFSVSQSLAQEAPGRALAKMITHAQYYGGEAAFVFDLDETIVDSTPRRYAAFLDTINQVCGLEPAHPDCPALRHISFDHLYRMRNRYNDRAYLEGEGVRDASMIEKVSREMFQLYLSGAYIVDEDRMILGALSFVRELKKWGAQVYYVSSRIKENQWGPTREFLGRRGLLARGDESFLYIRPKSEVSVEFKKRATLEIAARVRESGGKVFGIFENEPENLNVWAENFPYAKAFFILGAYQREGTIPAKSVVLEDFRF